MHISAPQFEPIDEEDLKFIESLVNYDQRYELLFFESHSDYEDWCWIGIFKFNDQYFIDHGTYGAEAGHGPQTFDPSLTSQEDALGELLSFIYWRSERARQMAS